MYLLAAPGARPLFLGRLQWGRDYLLGWSLQLGVLDVFDPPEAWIRGAILLERRKMI